ncbi:hypothetical protein TTHT_1737 [Thermotomaculum hydrothermale]|uniref:PPM-type phosphatase domain-containing protein n=1 Tax=Thermotomaculum hydrothermale TaxID=981385 RepID=A0A7R6Q0E1_9BACT|nr:PP2C family protein-serine/threonine phosphatase [Thermotomaculum hydrothermale]BBB33208.1 hypothetical protein TTHT_1737 [Thermotomaculum hydrothermale]
MNEKPLFIKFKAFFIFAITAVCFLFYARSVPDEGIVPLQTAKDIKVLFVKKNSEAFKKGVKPGFSIVGVNHKLVKSIDDIENLITYPETDFLFENNKGDLIEIILIERKIRRIVQPEIVFILISLLLYILSITLILNNWEIKELYFLHSAIFITHFASLAFIVSPSYTSFESFIVLAVLIAFPGVPFLLASFVQERELESHKKSFKFILPGLILIGYLILWQSSIIKSIAVSTGLLATGYFYLASIFKRNKSPMFFPSWFFYLSLYFGAITLIILAILIKGIILFWLVKLFVAQQIIFNALILYNILKYGISNKKLALKKSFVDAFIFLILLVLYTFLLYFLNKTLGENFISKNLKIYSIMLGILIVFILNPINEWIKDKLEFLLFKQERKLATKVFEITDKMITLTDSREIERYLKDILNDFLKLDIQVFIQVEKNSFKKLNSHKIYEFNYQEMDAKSISQTPLKSFEETGYEYLYHFSENENLKTIVLAKEPLTVQQKKMLEHIFIQFALTYQNIKLIEKAQRQIELERDMKIAGLIQKSLIPSFHPEGKNFEVYGISESARTVGGDFFDYLPSEDKKIKAIIGDVAGKSVPAAIMMVSAKETLFARSVNIDSPSKLMRESNRLLYLRSNKNMFVACIYFVFDPEKLTLNYINAGMPSPYLIRENTISILKKQKIRFPLGLLPDVQYQEENLKLLKGDTLIFMTDGVTESLGENIVPVLEECTNLETAVEIAKCVIDSVKRKTENILEDDATIIVLKIRE